MKKAPDWVMGTAKRDDMTNKNNKTFPGAGTYEIGSKMGEAPKYHIGSKLMVGGSMDTGKVRVPGPGAYSPNKRVYDSAIEFTMRKKTTVRTQMVIQPDGTHKTYAT